MYIVRGFGITIEVSLLSVLIGILIGVFVALAALSNRKVLKRFD